ncbi:peptidyl-prolyl cis-trans isomerase FKBP62 [Striga asiatica]|uniref:Peptidyl-prolyl cis-trans isomerase FKBP62 n=1 Tax=Striga asiatica TaxID=4170 RepID=A0A5A7PTD7_STRAF|nr:peptidyl-prolyl cis-trans isomerase FKBP62 [Striga asiatica]GER35785.1 peptidyl-prolyl cis-trans isomerase FKBP62 [Striga asiatica]GER35786.1 peptidyl-prolyl cis-trans isomerase FKBP62 [Striga asiatica]GER35787.1 peptidyl-prolyl cis-trans isomerase FKBP62 [Striga asiatica]
MGMCGIEQENTSEFQRDMKRYMRSSWALFSFQKFMTTISRIQAINFIDYDSSFREERGERKEEKGKGKSVQVSCNLNNAACKLELKNIISRTVKLSCEVLEIYRYRRAQAYIDLVEKDIKQECKTRKLMPQVRRMGMCGIEQEDGNENTSEFQRDMKRYMRSSWALFSFQKFMTTISRIQAINFIDYDSSFREERGERKEEKGKGKSVQVSCNLNNAACKLELKNIISRTVKLSCEVLEIYRYRRAQAYIDLKSWDMSRDKKIDATGKEDGNVWY